MKAVCMVRDVVDVVDMRGGCLTRIVAEAYCGLYTFDYSHLLGLFCGDACSCLEVAC